MTHVTFPIIVKDKLFLAKKYFGCEDNKIVSSIFLSEQKIICMNHSDDCLIALQDNGHVILIKNLQEDDKMSSITFDASDCNLTKVYCNDDKQFFAIDSDGQIYYIEGENNTTNITKIESPQQNFKVVDIAFGDVPYILYDNNKIFQFVSNPDTGYIGIISATSTYLPKRIPSGITASRLICIKTKFYLIDDMGNLYNNDCSNKVYKWKIDHKMHGIVGFYICKFTQSLFIINKVGELSEYTEYKTPMQQVPFLKEISGVGNYFIAKSDIGESLIGSCLRKDSKIFTFAILPTATTGQ